MAQRRPRQQPKGNSYPRLRPEFGGAVLVYAPWLSILHGNPWNATIITGTPTRTHGGVAFPHGQVVVRHNNSGISFPGTQSLDFSKTGISILAIGSMPSNSGTQINSLLNRADNSSNAGFELDIYNKFAAPNADRIYGGYNKAGVDTNWDRGYVNGVSDSLNGSFTTSNNTRYVIACSADSGPGSNATADIESGRASSSDSLFDIELVILWKRALTAQQLRNLSVDPYYAFVPQRSFFAMAEPASGAVSAALTGVAGTGSVGTLGVTRTDDITGNAGTGAAGTVAPSTAKALTGNAATSAVGSVTPVRSGAITGVSATGAPGTVAPSTTAAITGNAATASVGSVTPVRDVALTGNAGTGAAGTVTPALDKALTGNAATGSPGTVSPQASKALTGNAATGAAGTLIPSVTVALTGVSATGAVGSVSVDADATQALTGVVATGAAGTVAPSVTVALTGVSATGAVGSVTAGQPLTGVAGTGSAGNIGVGTSKAITGNAAASAIGSLSPDVSIGLSGVQAAGEVGSVAFAGGDLTIGLTGVQATGATGVLQVSGDFTDIAAAVWSYMLSNGKTAGQNVVEIRSLLDTLTPGFWDFVIEGTFTAADLLRVIAAVQAGKTTITPLGAGQATVEFRAVDDSEVRVTAEMDGSERTEVTLNAN